jgi:hypothetical protein
MSENRMIAIESPPAVPVEIALLCDGLPSRVTSGRKLGRAAPLFRFEANRFRQRMNPLVSAACALLFTVTLAAGAEARHLGKYVHRSNPGRETEPIRAATVRGGPLGVIMAQFIHDCERQSAELKNFPVDEIAQSVILNDAQVSALMKVHTIASEAAAALSETCPAAVSPNPADRLDMIERGIDGIEAAIKVLLPALTALYGSLNDEQKAQLTLRFAGVEIGQSRAVETTSSTTHTVDEETRRRSNPGSAEAAVSPPSQSKGWWNCGGWEVELRAWPINRVEQAIAVGPEQRGAFYELVAALHYAANALAESCPQHLAVTPVARILDLKRKLDGVRRSLAMLRPPLIGFYEVLGGDQRSRFNDAI